MSGGLTFLLLMIYWAILGLVADSPRGDAILTFSFFAGIVAIYAGIFTGFYDFASVGIGVACSAFAGGLLRGNQ